MRADSCICHTENLDLFRVPQTLTSVQKCTYIKKYPVSQDLNQTAPFEFEVKGSDVDFIDLARVRLYVRAKIVDKNNQDVSEIMSERLSTVNTLFHSLFKRIELRMGRETDVQISHSLPTHGYRCYIEELLSRSPSQSEQLGRTDMFYIDDAGKADDVGAFEMITVQEGEEDAREELRWRKSENSGFLARQAIVSDSKDFELFGCIKLDLFQQDRYLLNNVNLRLKLEKQDPSFFLLHSEANDAYHIAYQEVYLQVPYVTLSNDRFLEMNRQLLKTNAKYPIRRIEVQDAMVLPNFKTVRFDRLFSNAEHLPTRLVLGLVSNDRFAGTPAKNPYLFHHHNLESLTAKVDGALVSGKQYTFRFDEGEALEAFHDLYVNLGLDDTSSSLHLDYEQYLNGSTLYVLDLSADNNAGSDYFHTHVVGNFSLELTFATPPSTALNLIVYAEYESVIEINANRDVYASWT